MLRDKHFSMPVLAGIVLIIAAGFWLATSTPARAQCGSQASSCKNCHEVQGEMAVNSDGTAWHSEHAFGDFCYICHAGNNQAMGAEEAHSGMVAPLEDIKASCQQCHPDDLDEMAQVYASALGVEIGEGGPSAPASSAVEAEPAGGEMAAISAPAISELEVDDPNAVDFVQRYNEIVLGKRPVNKGNVILIVLIGMVMVGGGGFAFYNEVLTKLPNLNQKKVEGEYPEDVLSLLPAITNLEPGSRKSLKRILENPAKTGTVLKLIDTLVADDKDETERQ